MPLDRSQVTALVKDAHAISFSSTTTPDERAEAFAKHAGILDSIAKGGWTLKGSTNSKLRRTRTSSRLRLLKPRKEWFVVAYFENNANHYDTVLYFENRATSKADAKGSAERLNKGS